MSHSEENKECPQNNCGQFANCNNYACEGEHGCTCQQRNECRQCELEGNTGLCDRKECKNFSQPMSDWEERFENERIDGGSTLKELCTGGDMNSYENVKELIFPFIRQIEAQAEEREYKRGLKEAESNCAHSTAYKLGTEEARLATITLFDEWIRSDKDNHGCYEGCNCRARLLSFADSLKKKV